MLGYSGLLLIHPKQIILSNKFYMPSIKDIKIANQIINSNKSKKYEGQNISVLNNKLIGPPMIKRAEKILNLYKKKMKKIVLIGGGGNSLVILSTINDINKKSKRFKVIGFLDDKKVKLKNLKYLGKINKKIFNLY